jgi:hypothetical protein
LPRKKLAVSNKSSAHESGSNHNESNHRGGGRHGGGCCCCCCCKDYSYVQAFGERILAETVSTLIENNSPIALFSFHADYGLSNVDSDDAIPNEPPGLGSRPSPSSGFEVDCIIRTVADNVILNEPPARDASDLMCLSTQPTFLVLQQSSSTMVLFHRLPAILLLPCRIRIFADVHNWSTVLLFLMIIVYLLLIRYWGE